MWIYLFEVYLTLFLLGFNFFKVYFPLFFNFIVEINIFELNGITSHIRIVIVTFCDVLVSRVSSPTFFL